VYVCARIVPGIARGVALAAGARCKRPLSHERQ
jgi:hypothetical protein